MADKNSDTTNTTATVEWTVTGMDCAACATKIKNAVGRLPGVTDVNVAIMSERLKLTLADGTTLRASLIVAADGRSLARALRVAGKLEPVFVDDIADMPQAVLTNARDGDVVICMGAGTIGGVPAKVVDMGGAA